MITKSSKMYMGFFDMTLYLIVTDNIKKSYQKYEKRLGPAGMELRWAEGFAVGKGADVYVFLCRSPRGNLFHPVIAHEIRHAVDFCFRQRRIVYGRKGCLETAALAQEYLTRCIYGRLREWKQKSL